MYIDVNTASIFQEFFDFMYQEHNLILTTSEIQDILHESKKLEIKLHENQLKQ